MNGLIMVVEDDVHVRFTLQELLEDEGYRVIACEDGRDALRELAVREPDLVLCDIRMPHVDGYEVLEESRRRYPLCPFLFMTAKAEAADVRMGMSLGADDYLVKPFPAEDLVKVIRTRLDRARRIRAGFAEKDYFLSTHIPHRLRSPLTGVIGYAELILASAEEGRGLGVEDAVQFGSGVLKSGQRLLGLVDNLCLWMDLSRPATDTHRSARGEWRLVDWEAGVIHGLQHQADAYGRAGDFRPELAPASLALPEGYLGRVIGQLTDNAFKCSLPGTPVGLRGTVRDGGYRFEVTDHGRGLPPAAIKNYVQAQSFEPSTWEDQRIGFGFAIVHAFCALTGSAFTLEANESRPGLTAAVTVPLAR